MIFCTPKDKVTHCVTEILNGDKNSGDGDGWGWGQILVPVQLSTLGCAHTNTNEFVQISSCAFVLTVRTNCQNTLPRTILPRITRK